ncbi:hypothetical protein BLNAU_19482 [Blattamonas nauphoetae]|uniref:Uncharacterized protein n=1 Tax=Blattamonas nauphoetae TaxID=2049346 RepID=A0ABQ9X1C4_9EUKA|nr:hypothetical protein BLNAU_19482 [Blattamonas nauphoetae]
MNTTIVTFCYLSAPLSSTISDLRLKPSPTLSLRMGRTARMMRYLHAFLGCWIKQHVLASAEQELEHGVETKINRTLIAVHQLPYFSSLSNVSRFLVSDAEQCSESKY